MFIRLSTRFHRSRRALVWALLTMITLGCLSAPATALATPTSDRVFAPWFKDNTPWQGEWGAYNTKQSEAVGGRCVFSRDELDQIGKFLTELDNDQKIINGKGQGDLKDMYKQIQELTGIPVDSRQKAFREIYNHRLLNGKGMPKTDSLDKAPVPGAKGYMAAENAKVAETNNTIWAPRREVEDSSDVRSWFNASPLTIGCDQSRGTVEAALDFAVPTPFDLIKNPASFFIRLVTLPFVIPAAAIYSAVSTPALPLLLHTPHAERGESVIDTIKYANIASESSDGYRAEDGDVNRSVCKADRGSAGFDCDRLEEENQAKGAIWISIAKGLRNALSAVFGLIVIVVALRYMFFKNPQSAMDVRTALPNVLAAVVVAGLAPFVIGAAITFANTTVQSIVGFGGDSFIGAINQSVIDLTRGGNKGIGSIPQALIGAVLMPGVLTAYAFFMVGFVIMGFLRWMALVGVVVGSPVAALGIIVPAWRRFLTLWVRALLAICALPIAQALVITMGIAVSRAINSMTGGGGANDAAVASGSFAPMLMALMIVGSMWAAFSFFGRARAFVTGNKERVTRKVAGSAVQVGGQAGSLALLAAGQPAAAAAVGKAAQSGGQFIARSGSGPGMLSRVPGGSFTRPDAPATRGALRGATDWATGSVERAMHQKLDDRFPTCTSCGNGLPAGYQYNICEDCASRGTYADGTPMTQEARNARGGIRRSPRPSMETMAIDQITGLARRRRRAADDDSAADRPAVHSDDDASSTRTRARGVDHFENDRPPVAATDEGGASSPRPATQNPSQPRHDSEAIPATSPSAATPAATQDAPTRSGPSSTPTPAPASPTATPAAGAPSSRQRASAAPQPASPATAPTPPTAPPTPLPATPAAAPTPVASGRGGQSPPAPAAHDLPTIVPEATVRRDTVTPPRGAPAPAPAGQDGAGEQPPAGKPSSRERRSVGASRN